MPPKLKPYYAAANNAIKELVPMVPIAHGGSGVAYRADVEGAHAAPLGNEHFSVVKPGDRDTFVWMQNAEPISLYCDDETDGESLRACEQVRGITAVLRSRWNKSRTWPGHLLRSRMMI